MKSHEFEELNGLDAELRELARGLKEGKTADRRPPTAFTSALRGRLLETYKEKPMGWGWIWQWGSTAVGFVVLAVVVLASWLLFAQGNNFAVDGLTRLEVRRPPKDKGNGELIVLLNYQVEENYRFGDMLYKPGDIVPIHLSWRVNGHVETNPRAFLHLYDSSGRLIAQVDWIPGDKSGEPPSTWQIGEIFTETYSFTLPIHTQPATYQLVIGAFDPVSGQRLTIGSPLIEDGLLMNNAVPIGEIDVMEVLLAETITYTLTSKGYDTIEIYQASPVSGTELKGTEPITLTVELFYILESKPEAFIVIKLVEQLGEGGGREVASSTAVVQQGEGLLTLEIPFNPVQELSGSADLELLVQMQTDKQSAPFFIDMPLGYEWRYEP